MEFDFEGKDLPEAYKLLAGLVTPRPIALVTTIDEAGRHNAAPFSFFNVLGCDPPIVGFAPGNRDSGEPKDTARNIRKTGDFVVNLVDEAIAERMVACAASLPPGQSEIEHAGLTPVASSVVKSPRIAESPVHLECLEWGTLEILGNRLVIGLVKRLHVRDGLLDSRLRVIRDAYHPIGRMHGPDGYTRTKDFFALPRPD